MRRRSIQIKNAALRIPVTLAVLVVLAPPSFGQLTGPDIPDSISVQGYLTDNNGVAVDATVPITFKLYKGSTPVWSQVDNVVVSDGAFEAVIGGAFFDTVAFNRTVELGIKVGGDPEMSPRSSLVSAPYAQAVRGFTASWATGDLNGSPVAAMNVVAGSSNNNISGPTVGATVGGGGGLKDGLPVENLANGHWSTVGGGLDNSALGTGATVAGGYANEAWADYAFVGGGIENEAYAIRSTVGGGSDNTASSSYATVGGGRLNVSSGENSTIPGGIGNIAAGMHSFAAGGGAQALHDHTIVFSDGTVNGGFASTGPDQFLISASGGVGVGTATPTAQLHVVDSIDAGVSLSTMVAMIENKAATHELGPDVLGLRSSTPGGSMTTATNFITFFEGGGGSVGSIEGIPGPGISLNTSGADYAEFIPKRNQTDTFEAGQVIGIYADGASHQTHGALRVMVVSEGPAVVGNRPVGIDEDKIHDLYVKAAFVGQVPVLVSGPVRAGDYILASGRGDGAAIALPAGKINYADLDRIAGQAWESSTGHGQTRVNVEVGLDQTAVLQHLLLAQKRRLEVQESRLSALESTIRNLRLSILDWPAGSELSGAMR